MNIITTKIPDVFIVEPKVFGDDRGFFMESFNQEKWELATGLKTTFAQDNHSRSSQGVLRGLHYQLKQPQGKLVRCIVGEVFDVAVDIRKESPSFGKWVGEIISAENKRQFWVPEGFAHGFLVLSESADFLYKTTNYYAPQDEHCICWNDPDIGINWPMQGEPVLSQKDAAATMLSSAQIFES